MFFVEYKKNPLAYWSPFLSVLILFLVFKNKHFLYFYIFKQFYFNKYIKICTFLFLMKILSKQNKCLYATHLRLKPFRCRTFRIWYRLFSCMRYTGACTWKVIGKYGYVCFYTEIFILVIIIIIYFTCSCILCPKRS